MPLTLIPRYRTIAVAALALSAVACNTQAYPTTELPPAKADLPAAKPGEMRSIVLAGGCFWCSEATFEHVKGVTDVVSGYAGGSKETATYEQSNTGKTGHAESIKVTYDPAQITLGELLRIFFDTHDPTTLDRQGADTGNEYRSAIFYDGPEQKAAVEGYIKQLNDAKAFADPVVTKAEDLSKSGFYPAEDYHQNYATLHADDRYILAHVPEKVARIKERHAAFYTDRVIKP